MLVEIVLTGLPIDRDEVEQALEAAFGPDGEITGAGSGMGRSHLDLEVQASMDPGAALDRVHTVLAELGVDAYTTCNVRD